MLNKLKTNVGITLIEIMTTVVIIGIVATMAVPKMQKAYDRMEFRTTNRDITTTIRLARSMSVSDKQNYGVYFDYTTREMILFKKDPISSILDAYEPADSIVQVDSLYYILDYIGTDLVNSAIVFRPNGSATFTGGGNIITMKYEENMIGISITNIISATGRVKTQSYYY